MQEAGLDAWDHEARNARGLKVLASIAKRFLLERGDHALGIVPSTFLPPASVDAWLVYWCAVRRVDDSLESGASNPDDWELRLDAGNGATLAERCVAQLAEDDAMPTVDLRAILARSLEGCRREAQFSAPRPWTEYLELLEHKSVPTMVVFDALLGANGATEEHARAFAVSAQLADDCRDVFRDLARGRCFVTREELGNASDVGAFAASSGFVDGRVRDSLRFAMSAQRALETFQPPAARKRASRLNAAWVAALRSGQVRPSAQPMRVPASR